MKAMLSSTVILIALTGSTLACPLLLDKIALQGGLLIGRAPVGSKVSVKGKTVRVSNGGFFLIGFGRDADPKIKLIALTRNGLSIKCTINVTKREYELERIDGLLERQVKPRAEDIKRIKADNAAIARVRQLDTTGTDFTAKFERPVNGRISGKFGSQRILNGKPKRPHNGVDIAAPEGTPIRAPASGVVVLVHPDMFYTGKTVMLDHGHGLTSVYVHMSVIALEVGQRVKSGDEIGRVGKTGRATGPHLHWGVSLFSTHLDPELLVGRMHN